MGRTKGEEFTKKTYRLKPALIAEVLSLAKELQMTSTAMANIIVEEGIKAVKKHKKS